MGYLLFSAVAACVSMIHCMACIVIGSKPLYHTTRFSYDTELQTAAVRSRYKNLLYKDVLGILGL